MIPQPPDSGPKIGRVRAGQRVGRSNVLTISGAVAAEIAVPAFLNSIRVTAMLDIVFLVAGTGFFAASVLYVFACERM